jgi:hypothetical protein
MKTSLLAKNLCHCIKKVRKTVKLRPNQKPNQTSKQNKSLKRAEKEKEKEKEKAAIGICVKSVLHTRGKTLRKFSCNKKPYLLTQQLKFK